MRARHHRTTYAERSRSQRWDAYVSLRWRIARDPNGRGIFTSHQVLPGGRYDNGDAFITVPKDDASSWADITFLSRRRAGGGWFYNTTVRTAAMALADAAEGEMFDRVHDMLDEGERALAFQRPEFVRRGRYYEMLPPPRPVLARYGMTVQGLYAEALDAIVREGTVEVTTGGHFEEDYVYGQGLTLTVDEDNLCIDTLARVARAFLDGGEQEGGERLALGSSTAGEKAKATLAQSAAFHRSLDARARGLESEDAPLVSGHSESKEILGWR